MQFRIRDYRLPHLEADGTTKQIGRQCLRAFLPQSSMDPEAVAKYIEALSDAYNL